VLSRLEALHEDGTSVIVVTHDLRGVLEAADRVIGMSEGRVAFETDAEAAREELAALDVHVPSETAPSTPKSAFEGN
jgi:biotin transport system ATP-binding protein